MKKRILTILFSVMTCISVSAGYTQQAQVGTEKGLSCNAVKAFAKDVYGRLWVGTINGANLISNGTVRQYQYFNVKGQDIVTGDVLSIGCSRRAVIATTNHIIDFDPDNDSTRLVTYDGKSIRTEHILMSGDSAYFFNAPLCAVMVYDLKTCRTSIVAQFPSERQFHFTKLMHYSDDPNQILLVEDDRGFYHLNVTTGALTHMDQLGINVTSRASFIDSNSILWIAYKNMGITGYYVKSGFDMIAHYDKSNSQIPDNNVVCMAEMSGGNLLVCTSDDGFWILDRKNGTTSNNLYVNLTPMHVVCAMTNPKTDEVILGTLHRGIITLRNSFFHNISTTVLEHETESSVIPIAGYQDRDGRIWLGSGGFGVSQLNEKTEQQTFYKSTEGMRISSICSFDNENLLITERTRGLFLFNKRTGALSPATFLSDAGINISSSRLSHLKTITTPDGDIILFNCNGRHLIYRRNIKEVREIVLQMNGEENRGIVEDVRVRPSHATVVCNGCIYEIDYRTLLARLIFQSQDSESSPISNVVEDSQGIIWACSPNQLISYDPRANKLSEVMENEDNGVFLSLAIDRHDHLWITTDKALLLMVDTHKDKIEGAYTYYARDCGTMLNFLPGFSMVSNDGYVYFSHTSGLLVVNHDNSIVQYNSDPCPLLITKVVLDGMINESKTGGQNKTLSIPNKFSMLSVHVALNQFDPTKPVSLKYTLVKKGRPYPVMESVTNSTEFSIPRTTHGSFTLSVSQRTVQGWTEPQELLSYNVARPFIMTVPAYLLIIAIIVSISVTISKVGISLKQIDMDRAMNAQENKHKDDKISLLSNLAHELRTPLSLIYNPVKDMLEEKAVRNVDYERLERIFNQVQKMTEMVNLILDKGTNDISKSDIVIKQIDLNEWLGRIVEDFKTDCYAKGLKTEFKPMPDLGMVSLDPKMVETAINNIMTNAIKYSDTGTITITTGHDKGKIWMKFQDEGRGFQCKPEELFKRYYRENESVPGYGLGLSQAKLMIELMDGTIEARKNDGAGSTFTIVIPDNLGEKEEQNSAVKPQVPVIAETPDFSEIDEPEQAEEVNFDTKSMTLLIVDDQDDILQFIKDEYSPLFKTIYTAHDGKEALELIRQRMPNVVVSDIMMPRMNGFELCKIIKTDLELSSIPVILLTSRSDPKNQDMGYKMGADSFLPKPFDSKLLYKIIRSQLKNRFEIKRQYATSFFTAISEDQTFSAADEQFVLKLNRFIRENLSNTMLGVDMIVDHMNVSRTTLFNKMNNLVGASTNKYIRRIRIDVAKEMLSKTNKSVGTIAEETGFSESQYFSTVFKQETGMTPSQFKDSLRKV